MGIRDNKNFRILSLDGGGTWALLQARALMDLYPGRSGHRILEDFDVVAGTSGGSVVMAGLIDDMRPEEILALFTTRSTRQSLFCALPWYRKLLRLVGVGPQFATAGKLECLTRCFPRDAAKALGQLDIRNRKDRPVQFLITAYDYDRDRAVFFRSNADSAAANFPKDAATMSAVHAAHASSTAPVEFFDKPADFGRKRYWDGACTGLNNPVMVAVAEAIAAGVKPEEIGVLSIGTASNFLPCSGRASSPGLLQQKAGTGLAVGIKKIGSSIVADPPDTDTFVAHLMLGGKVPLDPAQIGKLATPLVRLNPVVRPQPGDGEWKLPTGFSAREFKRLASLDIAVIDDADVDLIMRFCNGWMAGHWINQPVRHGADLDARGAPNKGFCEIGHATYEEARQAW
ncbi:MAG TPA: patatin-like phospholipase family protein [Rhodocyclaceae bacterium]